MAAGKAHIKQPKKRKARNATIAIKGAPHKPIIGHEERLAAFCKRALQLKRQGYYHYEVGEMIAKEYDLEDVPAITTVADWLKKGSEAVRRDIEELQWQMRVEQYKELDRLKAKWMPIATKDELQVRRWEMVEGELQPTMDENALKEQIDATKAIVAIMNRQAKLLGLDMQKAITPDGDGPGTLQDLQVWLIGQINVSTGAASGGAIDTQAEVLELRSGIPDTDAV